MRVSKGFLFNRKRGNIRCQRGFTLIETVVALAIFTTVAAAFLQGISASSRNIFLADERATAESLARTQMEWAKGAVYSYNATSYEMLPVPSYGDYVFYTVNITAQSLHNPDEGIQKLTVNIGRSGRRIFTLEDYKVDR
jgi:prepilin-type N-terminal cleavage/methylation domain-containing protein